MALILIGTSTTNIAAASASISVSQSLEVGQSGTISVTTQAPGGFVQGSISSSNSNVTIGNTQVWGDVGLSETKNPSFQTSIRGVSAGQSNITVSIEGSDLSGNKFSTSKTFTVTVREVAPPAPNNGNSGLVDDPTRPSKPSQSPAKKETEKEKQNRLEREKKQAEELKKQEEERKKKELEEKKKTPLVTEIEFISKSDKLKGESIHKLETKKDVFEYEYVLPRRIDKFEIKPVAGKDVKLDFVKEHVLDADKKEIIIKADNGEIKQDIKLVVKKNNEKLLSKKVNDESYQVYEDELLTRFMDKFGFESKKDEKIGQYFVKNKINLQMLVDEDKNVHWLLLDDKLNFKDFVSPIFLKDQVFFVKEAPEETQKETLHGEKYQKTQRKVSSEFAKIDPELKYEYDYKSWPFHDGEIVYGFDESMNEDFYRFDNDSYKVAAVAFDMENTKWKRVAMVSGFGFLGLASTNAVSIYKKKKRV